MLCCVPWFGISNRRTFKVLFTALVKTSIITCAITNIVAQTISVLYLWYAHVIIILSYWVLTFANCTSVLTYIRCDMLFAILASIYTFLKYYVKNWIIFILNLLNGTSTIFKALYSEPSLSINNIKPFQMQRYDIKLIWYSRQMADIKTHLAKTKYGVMHRSWGDMNVNLWWPRLTCTAWYLSQSAVWSTNMWDWPIDQAFFHLAVVL